MAGIHGGQPAEILLEVILRGGSTATTYRLVPAWESCFDGGRAAVPSTEATASASLAAPAVPTPAAPIVSSLLLIVTRAGKTSPISLVSEGESVDKASLAEGTCSITMQVYPCQDRVAIRVFDLSGSQKKWRSTSVFSMCNISDEESQLLSTEQLFGKEILSFHVRKCEELHFPPFILSFANDFKVLKHLGQGSEGKVFKCSSKFSEFKCAVKEVVPSDFLIDESTTKKLAEPSEVTVMVKLNHANIMKIFLSWNGTGNNFMGYPSDATFICMMLSTRTLESYLKQRSSIELDTVNHLFRQIMMGVEHIHMQNVVHHDLKPGNILIDDDLSLKISDYGLAAIKDSPNSKLYPDTIGSFPYVAPEVNDTNKRHDERADIFSCGIIYFEMCTSKRKMTKVAQFSRCVRFAMASWQPWLKFDLDTALEESGLADGFIGNYLLLKMMLHADDAKRPSATDILAVLSGTDTAESLERKLITSVCRTA